MARLKNKRHVLMGPLAALAVVVLAACGTTVATTEEGTDSVTEETSENRVVTVAQNPGISQLNPNISTLSSERVMWNLLWDGLTTESEEAGVQPELATEWTTSEDGLTWTFSLRDDVTFHDGRPFGADDVVKTVMFVLEPENASPQRSKLSSVTNVVAVDDTTVEFTLDATTPQLPSALVDVKIFDVDNSDTINETGNGTGPFVLDGFVPDQELSVLPNKNYWGEVPVIDGIKVVKYADPVAARAALESGTIDVMWSVPFDQVSSLIDVGMKAVVPDNPSQASTLGVDTLSPPFDDPRARQALSYAIDRVTMQAVAFGGLGELNFGSTLVSPNNEYFAPDELIDYSYDLDKAKELFNEAGVVEGTTLVCWAGDMAPQYRAQCEVLQQSLAEIGITLDIEVNEGSTWAARFYPAGKEYGGLIVPNYLSREPAPLPFVVSYFGVDGWSPSNWPGNAEYEEAKARVQSVTATDDIRSAFADFQRITSEEQPTVVVMNVAQPSISRPDLGGVWMEFNGTIHVEGSVIQ